MTSTAEIIQEAANALEEKRFNEAEAETADYESKMEEEGITVIRFTDEELARFAEKHREEVWPEVKDDFDAELFDRVVGQ